MPSTNKIRLAIYAFCSLVVLSSTAQSILPPVIEWHGKSESLIAKTNDPWITATEKSGFVTTPGYKETVSWFKKLADASSMLTMVSIGKSVEGRDIYMLSLIHISEPTRQAEISYAV